MEQSDKPAKKTSAKRQEKAAQAKKYATVRHPTIEAVTEEQFYFANASKAHARLKNIRDYFVGRKQQVWQEKPLGTDQYLLWIRGYALTEEQEEAGYRGHFALLSVVQSEDELWTIRAERVDIALHQHPQRQRPRYNHPDWQYPILRSIKAGRIYDNYDQALGELETLHIDFPDVTIPGKAKLHLIIYEGKDSTPPTQKYLLEIEMMDEERCRIIATQKERQQSTPKLSQKRHADEEAVGSFTAKLKGERFRKK